jgi:hypothetical protein
MPNNKGRVGNLFWRHHLSYLLQFSLQQSINQMLVSVAVAGLLEASPIISIFPKAGERVGHVFWGSSLEGRPEAMGGITGFFKL